MIVGDIVKFIYYSDYGFIYNEQKEHRLLWINSPLINPFTDELIEGDFIRTDDEMDSNFVLITNIFRYEDDL